MTRICAISLLVFLAFMGCEGEIITEADIGDDDDNHNTELTFAEIQTQVFTPSCATSGCHSGTNPQAGLNLSAGQAYANIVNVNSRQMPTLKLIDPGNSADSYLIRKLTRQNISGNRMPSGRPPLSSAKINSISQWVDQGAPNN